MCVVLSKIMVEFRRVNFSSFSCFLVITLMLSSQAVHAKKMFRWTDENGKVHVADQLPPDQVKHRRESLNDKVRIINVVEKEKTQAQREMANRLAKLRKQQEEIIAKQKAHDKVLLSTFRSIKDMNLALEGKMLALDGQIKVVQGNLQRLEDQLQQQQKRAAQFERDDRTVPAVLLTQISASKKQMELAFIEISKQIEKKKIAKEKFEVDMERFNFLNQSSTESKAISHKAAQNKATNELGLFICETLKQCEKAWKGALKFVKTFSTTALDIESETLIMSQAPYKDTDLSLSVSKMSMQNKKLQLFLDIRCRNSSLGDELCRGAKVKKIRNSFSNYIKSTLTQ